jgi:hypothetical protein
MLIAVVVSLPVYAQSADLVHEIRIGAQAHDVDGLWSGFSREKGTDYNGELIFTPEYYFLGGIVRPNLGISINDSGDASKIYGGGLLEYTWRNGIFFDAGLGIAAHNGETDDQGRKDKKELGFPILFRVTFELGVTVADHHRLSMMFDHISNAYIFDPNEGLDTLE